MSTPSLRVGVLGATGAVGQKFVRLLADHPWFELTALAASERSAGKSYREAVNWIDSAQIPAAVADMDVVPTEPPLGCDFVFSGLSSSVAKGIEQNFANAGYPVISNAKNHRMVDNIPLLIPEINPDHVRLIEKQEWRNGGWIVTNPNCSTVGMVAALKPMVDRFGVESVQVTTMQALSGAGYPGVPSLDALGNVIPYIGGEEEKMASEPLKMLGTLDGESIRPASISISAQCNRVPVLEGHLEAISVKLQESVAIEDLREAFTAYESPIAELDLPSAPEQLIKVFTENDAPQPRRHASIGKGMTISVGRLRPCEVLDFKFVALVHNTLRGAAGVAVLNAELLARRGYLTRRSVSVGKATS
jgi:aspartate-semialdehyde dehydrogenase